MVAVRKAHAGSDSHGNEWAEDGAVVEVPLEQAAELVAIRDGGFSIVDQPAPENAAEGTGNAETDGAGAEPESDASEEVSEETRTEIDEAPQTTRRARKNASQSTKGANTVEE